MGEVFLIRTRRVGHDVLNVVHPCLVEAAADRGTQVECRIAIGGFTNDRITELALKDAKVAHTKLVGLRRNAWTDNRTNLIRHTTSGLGKQSLNGAWQHTGDCPAPAGVHYRHRTIGVPQQNWGAVCGSDSDRRINDVYHRCIGIYASVLARSLHQNHVGSVDLA